MDRTKDALLECLDIQRAHVLGCIEGLDPSGLRQAPLPTGWTCIGLLHHLTVDVERFWFGQVVAGERIDEAEEYASGWAVGPDVPPELVIDGYRAETERAGAIIRATPLDAAPRYWPDTFGSWRLPDLRAVLLHVITETACHAGHLDAARELLDGTTWLILD